MTSAFWAIEQIKFGQTTCTMYLVSLEGSLNLWENGVYFILISWKLIELYTFQIYRKFRICRLVFGPVRIHESQVRMTCGIFFQIRRLMLGHIPQNLTSSPGTTNAYSHKVLSKLGQEFGWCHIQKNGFGLQPFDLWWWPWNLGN